MTIRNKILACAALATALASLLFGQARSTGFTSILLQAKSILDIPLKIKLAAGQTALAIRVHDSSSNVLYSVDPTGKVTAVGGNVQTSATATCHFYTGFEPPPTTTTGTDTAAVNGTVWIGEIFVPANCTATGISYLLGSVGGTDKVVAALFSSAGAILANSALDSSVTAGTTATFQRVPFTAPYAVTGPGKYYVGVQFNGTTAKLRTQAFGDHDATSASQTFNTLVAITPPATFTASKSPIAMTY